MSPKPTVFKIHGCWVWLCAHDPDHATPIHSGRFTAATPSPWAVCLASAVEHHAAHHGAANVEEV